MKIELILGENPTKKRPYKLSHKYKPIVQKEMKGMLSVDIIYPIDKDKWEIPMVVQPKKRDPRNLRICVDFRGLNKLTLMDSFPTLFANEIINEVTGLKCYSFTYGFPGYNHVPIAKGDQPNMKFVFEFLSFTYMVMPFGLKNAPIAFSRIVVKSFQEYIYKTMVVYFNEWMI